MRHAVLALLLAASLFAQDKKFNSYKDQAPPELDGDKEHWLNSSGVLTFAKLKGLVVWVEFAEIGWPYCQKSAKLLTRWHKEYADKGLVIIDLKSFKRDGFDQVKKHAEDAKIEHPILWDKDGSNFTKYGIKILPISYLIGVDGKVIWEGQAFQTTEECEKLLKEETAKIKKQDLDWWLKEGRDK